jgi:colanic acid biosynthesis protein WcaH
MLRNNRPARGEWFTPGGRILLGEKIEDAVRRVTKAETGLKPTNIEIKGAMSHIWPSMQTVTVFCRVEVEDDAVKMDDQHSAYKWITEPTEDLHPYLKEMIEKAGIFL